MKMYSVKDNKTGAFGTPFFVNHEQEALRQMSIAANDTTLQLCIFANDFDLYELGTFDQTSGDINKFKQPQFVVGCMSFKKSIKGEENGNKDTLHIEKG